MNKLCMIVKEESFRGTETWYCFDSVNAVAFSESINLKVHKNYVSVQQKYTENKHVKSKQWMKSV